MKGHKMSKIGPGYVFACYDESHRLRNGGQTHMIVGSNGEIRNLTEEEKNNPEIKAQMAQNNTLPDYLNYKYNAYAPGTAAPSRAHQAQVLSGLMNDANVDGLSTQDIDEIAKGKWSKYQGKLTPDQVAAAQAYRQDNYSWAREDDRKSGSDGLLKPNELNSGGTTGSPPPGGSNQTADADKHRQTLGSLSSKAGQPMNLQDIDEIANGKWSKYNGTLTQDEINAAKAFKENDYKLSRDADQGGNKNGLLDGGELTPEASTTPPSNTPPSNTPPPAPKTGNYTHDDGETMVELMKKAGVDHLGLDDLNQIGNGKWSKYGSNELTEQEIEAARRLANNNGALARQYDLDKNAWLDMKEVDFGIDPNNPDKLSYNWHDTRRQNVIDAFGTENFGDAIIDSVINAGGKYYTDENNAKYIDYESLKAAFSNETDLRKRAVYSFMMENFKYIDGTNDRYIGSHMSDNYFQGHDIDAYFRSRG